MRRALPPYVSEFSDRHGKIRVRYRRKGQVSYYFKALPGTPGFWQEYEACKAGLAAPHIEPGERRAKPGTFDDLISRYYRSPEFLDPSDRTRAVYRGVLERFRDTVGKGVRYGDCMVRDLEPRHIKTMLADKASTPTAANMLRKRLRALMQFAIGEGLRRDNPVSATRPYKVDSKGFHTWTEEEIGQFEAHHSVGSKARLALALFLCTGQRRGDVRQFGRQHVRSKRLILTQEKTGASLSLPILPELAEAIMARPLDNMTFLVTAHGKPFTSAGFGNWFRDQCDAAGLPQCSAHGLRKAAARRFADAGCSNQQIKSWTGHTTDSEVARYTRAADQVAMADAAAVRLAHWMANRDDGLDNSPINSLKGDG